MRANPVELTAESGELYLIYGFKTEEDRKRFSEYVRKAPLDFDWSSEGSLNLAPEH